MSTYVPPPPAEGDFDTSMLGLASSAPSKVSAYHAAFVAESPETEAASSAPSAGSKRPGADPTDLPSLKRASLAESAPMASAGSSNLGDYLSSESEDKSADDDSEDGGMPQVKDIVWDDLEQQQAMYKFNNNCDDDGVPDDIAELVSKNIKKMTKDDLTVALHCLKPTAIRPTNAPALRTKLLSMVLKAFEKKEASKEASKVKEVIVVDGDEAVDMVQPA